MNFYTSIFKGKKFLQISVVATLLMLLVQFVMLEYFARYEREKIKIIIPVPNNITLALLGTSHTNYGSKFSSINPSIFNYGSSYTYPIIMHKKLKNLIKNTSSLKYLLIEADYHQFYDFSYLTPGIYSKYSHLLSGGGENAFVSLEKEVSIFLHRKLFDRLVDQINIWLKKEESIKNNPNNWAQLSQDIRERITKKRYNFFGFSNEKNMNNHSINYYQKTIELAQKNNIEVILIRHPLTNEYLNNMYPKMKTDVDRLINKLSKKYNLKKFDYRYIFKDNQNLFSDMDHLNENGIHKFSKILMSDIITKTSFSID